MFANFLDTLYKFILIVQFSVNVHGIPSTVLRALSYLDRIEVVQIPVELTSSFGAVQFQGNRFELDLGRRFLL